MSPTANTTGHVEELQKGSARYLYLPAMVAAIGGLLFGFDTAVINGAIVFIKRQFLLSDAQTEIAAGSLLLGCVVGASLAAFTSDRFGRKKVLLGAAALFTVSSIGAALPRDLIQFAVARLLGGVAIGIASTLSPLYIAEISPARMRGLLVSLNQLAIVTGILLSYSVNYLLTGAGPTNWRWMFASAAVPSVFFLLTLLFIPESPRWLMQKGRDREAERFLSQIGGAQVAAEEMRAIRAAIAEESGNLLDPAFRKALIVAIVIALFSQFTGINTIIYYGSIVFLEHVPHQTASSALWANVIIGAINFVATILGMALIDRAGRKPLLMSAFAGMALSLIAVSAAIHFEAAGTVVLIFVLTYVACFAVGVGTGTWVMMSEICPPMFQETQLFARRVGAETDIVSEEMYTWEDGARADDYAVYKKWMANRFPGVESFRRLDPNAAQPQSPFPTAYISDDGVYV